MEEEFDYLYNIWVEICSDLDYRIWCANALDTGNVKLLTESLNPNKQDRMTSVRDFCNKHSNVTYNEIISKLESLGYIAIYEDENMGTMIIPMCEGMQFCLKPRTMGTGRYKEFVGVEHILVFSKEIEKDLEEYCNQKNKKI